MSPILNLPSLVTAAGLSDADCTIQAAPHASPLKWHLGHTAWFFDKFLFGNDTYDHIFNSYYNAVGPQHARGQRGLLSRPALSDLLVYHENIMRAVAAVPAELPIEAYESLELRRMLPKYEGLDQDDPQTYIHVYGRNDRSRPDPLTTPACPSSNIKLSGPQVLNWLEGQYDKNPE